MTFRTMVLAAIAAFLLPAAAHAQTCNKTATVSLSASIAATEIVPVPSGPQSRVIVCGFTLTAGDGLSSLAGTNPAVGAEISDTVPANARWRPLAMSYSFVTSATVANRETAVTFDDGTTVYSREPSRATQAASLTRQYALSPMNVFGTVAQDTTITVPLPDVWLPAGHRIRTATTALQAGDDYSAPQYLVQEYTVFKVVTGTGTNCGTGQADATGVFAVRPSDALTVTGTNPAVVAPSGAAVCLSNLRPTTITGTLSYGVY